jgi:putative toxin-antitoxin system antitoxin component (TIGR02293 family)
MVMSEDPISYGAKSYLGPLPILKEAALKYGAGPLQKVAIIKKGLPLNALAFFLNASGLSKLELASILQVSVRTLQRYQPQDPLPPAVSEKLLALNDLYQAGARALGGSAKQTTQWLKEPCPALGNRLPLSLLDTYAGTSEVQNVLGRLEHGVYA